jgi:hypothetical protein
VTSPKLTGLAAISVDRAIYIDLEGTQEDQPTLLGVLYPDDLAPDGAKFIQYVWEEVLFPAARHRELGTGERSWCVISSSESTFHHVLELAERHDRHIVAWSTHELNTARLNLAPADRERFRLRYVNAIEYARPWLRKAHPGLAPPKQIYRGRHRLDWYMKLIGLPVPTAYAGNTATRVRNQLATKGTYKSMTPVAKGKRTKLLMHNSWDCVGMREVPRAAVDRVSSASGRG